MPSDLAKLKKQQKAAALAKRRGGGGGAAAEEAATPVPAAGGEEDGGDDVVGEFSPDSTTPRTVAANGGGAAAGAGAGAAAAGAAAVELNPQQSAADRSSTGVSALGPLSRDIKIINLSLTFHGRVFLTDTSLELNHGRRYGLVGPNGCGKSTLLNVIGSRPRELPIPEMIDIYHLHSEYPATDLPALAAVCAVDDEKSRLEAEADALVGNESDDAQERLADIYERLDELGGDLAEKRAAEILFGLGFTAEMQQMKTRDFSGGWRMRIALARALYVNPTLLILDEPTNHLDLSTVCWLEDHLAKFNRILLVVSHSQDFLNNVCTNIIHMQKGQLQYYSGNYDTYVRARAEREENQMKQYNWEQDQIAHMKEYIARFGHGSAKLARQAQSKEKTLDKMVRSGLTEKVEKERTLSLRFIDCGKLPPPVMQFTNVDFNYPGKKCLLKNLDFGVDLDSRIALVGPNGAGKSTLLKLMVEELFPTNGGIRKHSHLRIARYHQHFVDALNLSQSPIEYVMEQFPDMKEVEQARRVVGRFGITGTAQVAPMRQLSDGQKARVQFAWMCLRQPHLLLLDEPTNALDIETIDALGEALRVWDGGMVLVSHDFRLIGQVAKEIWVVENQKVQRWEGDILSYKNHLRRRAGLAATRH